MNDMSILELSFKARVDEAVSALNSKRSEKKLRSHLSEGATTREWTGGEVQFMSHEVLKEISLELRTHYEHLYQNMDPFEFVGEVLAIVTKLTRKALNEHATITIGSDTNGKLCFLV